SAPSRGSARSGPCTRPGRGGPSPSRRSPPRRPAPSRPSGRRARRARPRPGPARPRPPPRAPGRPRRRATSRPPPPRPSASRRRPVLHRGRGPAPLVAAALEPRHDLGRLQLGRQVAPALLDVLVRAPGALVDRDGLEVARLPLRGLLAEPLADLLDEVLRPLA